LSHTLYLSTLNDDFSIVINIIMSVRCAINYENLLIILLIISFEITSGFSNADNVDVDEIIKYKQLSYANLPVSGKYLFNFLIT
jgi:hypothetical protein